MLSRDSVERWLCAYISKSLGGVDSVDRSARFREIGLDSLGLIHLTRALGEHVGVELPATAVWEYSSIADLAGFVVSSVEGGGDAGKIEVAAPAQREPIAIVGMACRFPGGANTPESFWRMICAGVDAVAEIPRSRWDVDAFHGADPDAPGKMVTRRGGFLDQAVIEGFDAGFFSIAPREALHMDPQQRLMLELTWEAFEDAGMSPSPWRGRPVGVFLGVVWTDYEALRAQRVGTAGIGPYTVTGFHHSIVANRVSYTFGFQGPSLAVDTACSSSLVAVQLACESLRRGESTLAIAGGVNLNIVPDSTVGVSKFGALSPDGRCYSFDDRANGYVRGEGAGAVLLKPLSRALADGDRIYCVLLDGAINNDGASNGLTAPNPQAQEFVLRAAYGRSGVAGQAVHYIEAHGTGTKLGDPIEAKALGAVFGAGRDPGRPLRVGSVKTNIGHLEAASGAAGLIKLALAIHHRAIPPSINFVTPNSFIAMDQLRLAVQRELGPWPAQGDELAVGGVSSFGFGGTNAHLVVREAALPRPQLFALAAEDPGALAEAAARHVDLQATLMDARPLGVLCGDLAAGSSGPARLAAVVRSAGELVDVCAAHVAGASREGLHVGVAARPARLAFVFSGQGSHWLGMGRTLLREEPVFRATIERCDALVRRFLGWSLLDELNAEPAASRLDDIEVTCPVIVSVEIALAALWRAWGVEPDMIVGHSIGEVAAAHVAGALDLEDAMRVICHHGRTIGTTRGRGAMGLAAISWDEAGEIAAAHRGRLDRAIHSSARSSVFAGDPQVLDEVFAGLTARGVFCRRVNVDVAAHSYQLDGLREHLTAGVAAITPRALQIPVLSSVVGGAARGEDMTPAYWTRNLAESVLFSEAIDAAVVAGCEVFLEVSPHAIVNHAIADNLAALGRSLPILPSQSRGEDGRTVMLSTLARLVAQGHAPRWSALAAPVAAAPDRSVHVLPLSARTPDGLGELAGRWVEHLEARPWIAAADACFTAGTGRPALACRAAIVAPDRDALLAELRALSGGGSSAAIHVGRASTMRIAFLLTGQGAQAPNMGRALYERHPAFRAVIDRCDAALRGSLPVPLLEVLYPREPERPPIEQTQYTQPALFALEVALAELWRAWGVVPDALLGHSVGEFAAAAIAGVMTLEDGLALIAARGRLMQALPAGGAMVAIRGAAEPVAEALAPWSERVSIAAFNGPTNIVISGDGEAVARVVATLVARGLECQPLRVSHAFHSPLMEPMLDAFAQELARVELVRPTIPLISNLTGEVVGDEITRPEYWLRHVREPVRFGAGAAALDALGCSVFLELGPHPVLSAMASEALADAGERLFVPSLRRGRDDWAMLAEAVARLHARGAAIDWRGFDAPFERTRVPLPTYPWQRQRFWIDAPARPAAAVTGTGHPLFGQRLALPSAELQFVSQLDAGRQPYLVDHQIYQALVVPAAFSMATLVAIQESIAGDPACALAELVFQRPIVLGAEGLALHLTLAPERRGHAVQVMSRDARSDGWTLHVGGGMAPLEGGRTARRIDVAALRARCPEQVAPERLYAALRSRGIDLGPAFQCVRAAWRGEGEVLAEILLPDAAGPAVGPLHPIEIDAAFQLVMMTLAEFGGDGVFLPFNLASASSVGRAGICLVRGCLGSGWRGDLGWRGRFGDRYLGIHRLRSGGGGGCRLARVLGEGIVEVLGRRLCGLLPARDDGSQREECDPGDLRAHDAPHDIIDPRARLVLAPQVGREHRQPAGRPLPALW